MYWFTRWTSKNRYITDPCGSRYKTWWNRLWCKFSGDFNGVELNRAGMFEFMSIMVLWNRNTSYKWLILRKRRLDWTTDLHMYCKGFFFLWLHDRHWRNVKVTDNKVYICNDLMKSVWIKSVWVVANRLVYNSVI